jgi:hypothetical protein
MSQEAVGKKGAVLCHVQDYCSPLVQKPQGSSSLVQVFNLHELLIVWHSSLRAQRLEHHSWVLHGRVWVCLPVRIRCTATTNQIFFHMQKR